MSKCPAIKFSKHDSKWQQRNLGEESDIITGGTPNTEIDSYWFPCEIPWLSSGEVHKRRIRATDVAISEEGLRNSSAKWVPSNSVLVALAGQGKTRGTAAITKIPLTTNQSIAAISIKQNLDPEFLLQNLTKRYTELRLMSSGAGSRGGLNKQIIREINVFAPQMREQEQIASLFRFFDENIEYQQRKYDKLLTCKKAMLEKMFPKDGAAVPEVRFAGFEGSWSSHRIGDIASEAKRPVVLLDDETYQLVTVKRRNEGIVSRGSYVGKQILVKTYFEVRDGDYLISKRQIVHGANGLVPNALDRAVVSNEYLVIVSNDTISTQFWTLISKTPIMYKLFFVSSYGVDIEKLVFDVDDWKARSIRIPERAEQDKLVAYFDQLDHLITSHQEKIDRLKKLKHALLEKMFV